VNDGQICNKGDIDCSTDFHTSLYQCTRNPPKSSHAGVYMIPPLPTRLAEAPVLSPPGIPSPPAPRVADSTTHPWLPSLLDGASHKSCTQPRSTEQSHSHGITSLTKRRKYHNSFGSRLSAQTGHNGSYLCY